MFKHILIPTDGSPIANKAVKAGIKFAKEIGARVTAYHAVAELLPQTYGETYVIDQQTINQFDRRVREAGQRQSDAIGKLAKMAGVPFVSVMTRDNAPHEGIIRAAKKHKCDVIFMASHGRRGLAGLLMGSVTQKVLTHSKIPVLVYR
jgi:nucleotide-binding universal stress UspA family protein